MHEAEWHCTNILSVGFHTWENLLLLWYRVRNLNHNSLFDIHPCHIHLICLICVVINTELCGFSLLVGNYFLWGGKVSHCNHKNIVSSGTKPKDKQNLKLLVIPIPLEYLVNETLWKALWVRTPPTTIQPQFQTCHGWLYGSFCTISHAHMPNLPLLRAFKSCDITSIHVKQNTIKASKNTILWQSSYLDVVWFWWIF